MRRRALVWPSEETAHYHLVLPSQPVCGCTISGDVWGTSPSYRRAACAECTFPLPPSVPQTLPEHLLLDICLCPPCVLQCWVSTRTMEMFPGAFLQCRVRQHPLLATIATSQLMNNSKWHLFTKIKRRKTSFILWFFPKGVQPHISLIHSSCQLHQGIREEEGASLWAGEPLGRNIDIKSEETLSNGDHMKIIFIAVNQ